MTISSALICSCNYSVSRVAFVNWVERREQTELISGIACSFMCCSNVASYLYCLQCLRKWVAFLFFLKFHCSRSSFALVILKDLANLFFFAKLQFFFTPQFYQTVNQTKHYQWNKSQEFKRRDIEFMSKTGLRKKGKNVQMKKLIDVPCKSNIRTVLEEHVAPENIHSAGW